MKNLRLLLILLLPLRLYGATIIPAYSMANYDREITHIYQNIKATNIRDRVIEISKLFLDKPYVFNALGEGKTASFDQGPLYRTDAFDCVTYVSTVLALAHAHNLTEFQTMLKRINYHSNQVKFVTRNHFMSVDWNMVNQQHGYIKDITQQITAATSAQVIINKPAWYRKLPATRLKLLHPITPAQESVRLQQLHNLANLVRPQPAKLFYLPINTLLKQPQLFDKIPTGSIIEIVRPNWDLTKLIGTKMLISHLGFAIRTPQGLMFREASSLDHKVVDVPLLDYLKQQVLTSPTVKGINVQLVI